MTVPLLATKWFLPPAGKGLVVRPRLQHKLDGCLEAGCRLALVSAPAGFGKTTLLSTWAAGLSDPGRQPPLSVAWLSIDDGDNDPPTFWGYLISALERQQPGLGKQALALLQVSNQADLTANLAALVNDLSQLTQHLLLVLDDYHRVRNPAIHSSLSFLIEHAPPLFHLIVVSRTVPPLALALLRGRGQLLELHLDDLRFSDEEAASYLNDKMELAVPAEAVAALNAKTEGWAAGLQMAALSLHGSQDVEAFIDSFSGSNRYILDYLVEEVLKRQPAEVYEFLLDTSLLDSFCASLCDFVRASRAMASTSNSQEILSDLEDSNLFIIPLDAERHWYRYHPLFADLVAKRLRQDDPARLPVLHRLASTWYEQNGYLMQAIEHAFSACDYSRAAGLLEKSIPAFHERGQHQRLAGWIQKLPREVFEAHLRLRLSLGLLLVSLGRLEEAEQCVNALEDLPAEQKPVGADGELFASRIAAIRATLAIYHGDEEVILRATPLALEGLSAPENNSWRCGLLTNLSYVNIVRGDLESAAGNLAEAVQTAKDGHIPFMVFNAMGQWIMVLWMQGRLSQAASVAQDGLRYIEQYRLEQTPGSGVLQFVWGFILCEQGRLDEAGEFIRLGVEHCRSGLGKWARIWSAQSSLRYWIARGDFQTAERAVYEAETLGEAGEVPLATACGYAAMKERLLVFEGRLAEADAMLRERGISPQGEIRYPHHGEYHSLALLLYAKGELEETRALLERMLSWAQADRQRRMEISIRLLQALNYHKQNHKEKSLESLEAALEIAEPEGFIQIFLDEGEALVPLLRAAARQGICPQFASRLLELQQARRPGHAPEPQPGAARQRGGIATSLSEREIEVVRLIAQGCSNKEIAQKLCISLRTVKYHTTGIYTKLDVNGRAQAALRAEEMGLLNE